MRNAALAIWVAVAAALCLFHSKAAAQTTENDKVALQKFWASVAEAAKTRNVDIETAAFHWVFLVSSSGNDSNNAVAQSERNLLRNCAASELYADKSASDIVSLIPYQNRVRDNDVRARLMVGTPEADAKAIATYLPSDVKEETNDRGKAYSGGHDTEAAIAWTLDPKREILKPDERNFILIVLGPTDRSNQPTNAVETNFQSYAQIHPQEYRQALNTRGIASGKPIRDFAMDYEDKGKRWRVYGSVYLPANLTGTPFLVARPHITPIDPDQTPTKTEAAVPVEPPPATSKKDSAKNTLAKNTNETGARGDSGAGMALLLFLLAAAGGATVFFRYFRPVHVDVQVGNESSKELLTFNFRQKIACVYGPNTKEEDKNISGAVLKASIYDQFPPGKLAEINYKGGGKIYVKGELCVVKGLEEASDGSVVVKVGETEKLVFVSKQNDVSRSVAFEVR